MFAEQNEQPELDPIAAEKVLLRLRDKITLITLCLAEDTHNNVLSDKLRAIRDGDLTKACQLVRRADTAQEAMAYADKTLLALRGLTKNEPRIYDDSGIEKNILSHAHLAYYPLAELHICGASLPAMDEAVKPIDVQLAEVGISVSPQPPNDANIGKHYIERLESAIWFAADRMEKVMTDVPSPNHNVSTALRHIRIDLKNAFEVSEGKEIKCKTPPVGQQHDFGCDFEVRPKPSKRSDKTVIAEKMDDVLSRLHTLLHEGEIQKVKPIGTTKESAMVLQASVRYIKNLLPEVADHMKDYGLQLPQYDSAANRGRSY